jgi:hypothetical protein
MYDRTKPQVIMEQKISTNPLYIKPPFKKPIPIPGQPLKPSKYAKPSWEHDYVPQRPPSPPIPQAKMHYTEQPRNNDKYPPRNMDQPRNNDKYPNKRYIKTYSETESNNVTPSNEQSDKLQLKRTIKPYISESESESEENKDNIKPFFNPNKDKYPETRKIKQEEDDSDSESEDIKKVPFKKYVEKMYPEQNRPRTDFSKPLYEKEERYNKPYEKQERYNKPYEKQENYNKPYEKQERYNKPYEKQESYEKPQNDYYKQIRISKIQGYKI